MTYRRSQGLFGLGNEKFVKPEGCMKEAPVTHLFCVHHFLRGRAKFDRNDVPLAFKVTPDTLLNLALRVVDEIPLPPVYDWHIEDICRWLRQLGYPQYQNTFKVNLINGRTLLLVDASALSAMNIKDFDHIRHLTHNIRRLFAFQMTKFGRSISLPREYYHELYKLFRVHSGPKYELTRRSDLWRQLRLIRQKAPNLSHWELLERSLGGQNDNTEVELIGGAPRPRLYHCDLKLRPPYNPIDTKHSPCTCLVPPCTCYWTEEELGEPAPLSCVGQRAKKREISLYVYDRQDGSRKHILRFLKKALPWKYESTSKITLHPSFATLFSRRSHTYTI